MSCGSAGKICVFWIRSIFCMVCWGAVVGAISSGPMLSYPAEALAKFSFSGDDLLGWLSTVAFGWFLRGRRYYNLHAATLTTTCITLIFVTHTQYILRTSMSRWYILTLDDWYMVCGMYTWRRYYNLHATTSTTVYTYILTTHTFWFWPIGTWYV
jgi:hypothetical protein